MLETISVNELANLLTDEHRRIFLHCRNKCFGDPHTFIKNLDDHKIPIFDEDDLSELDTYEEYDYSAFDKKMMIDWFVFAFHSVAVILGEWDDARIAFTMNLHPAESDSGAAL